MTTQPSATTTATPAPVVDRKELLSESLFGATGMSCTDSHRVAERLMKDPDIAFAVDCYAMIVDAVVAEEAAKAERDAAATA